MIFCHSFLKLRIVMNYIFGGFIGILLGISLFSSVLAGTPELIMIIVAFFVGASFLKGIVETLFDIFK